jgi:hypothetical protein
VIYPACVGADSNHLHGPDEIKFRLGRHRPANTFPPVFTGLSNFSMIGVGFYPIYESIKTADTGVGRDMKSKLLGLSQRYVAALRKHLQQGPQASLKPALRLGREAVTLGLETLELARIHEQSLATLELSKGKNAFTKLAGIFLPRPTC